MSVEGLFEPADEFPNPTAGRRYAGLVGLDDTKEALLKEASLLLDPTLLGRWSKEHHGIELPIVEAFRDRLPMFVFAGDVGVGKTELAETFGDTIAREENIPITLMKLSLSSRGSGRVGEMTDLITRAFTAVEERVSAPRGGQKPSSAIVLLIDEADALAQSRELAQMHHEDRAGVNALVRGISRVAAERLPVITVLCTNRLSALDPAVERRAARIFAFTRPSHAERRTLLEQAFAGAGFEESAIDCLVQMTGATGGRSYGYSYSDIRTRLIPSVVLDAYPDRPLSVDRVVALIEATPPSRPFETETI